MDDRSSTEDDDAASDDDSDMDTGEERVDEDIQLDVDPAGTAETRTIPDIAETAAGAEATAAEMEVETAAAETEIETAAAETRAEASVDDSLKLAAMIGAAAVAKISTVIPDAPVSPSASGNDVA